MRCLSQPLSVGDHWLTLTVVPTLDLVPGLIGGWLLRLKRLPGRGRLVYNFRGCRVFISGRICLLKEADRRW